MHTIRRTIRGIGAVLSAVVLSLILLVSSGAVLARAASPAAPTLPQGPAATAAAQWLVSKMTAGGYIAGNTPGSADYSGTVNSLLALAAANTDVPLARTGLAFMAASSNTEAYVSAQGSDGPGQLSLLILAAHALGADPTNFGGTNLVSRLLATEQTTGPNVGRFGTDAQVPDFNSGPYDQGLALAALAAAGVTADQAAESWLVQAQCPDGGWTSPDLVDTPCSGDPAQGGGPDTNTTALALEGLAAQRALSQSVRSDALTFLDAAQNADGGWAYEPNAPDNQQTSDPNSTALVIQALLAMGMSPDSAPFDVGGKTPTSLLLSFVVTSGADKGAFFSAFGSPTTGDLLATYQAIPAAMALSFPFGPQGASYWIASANGSVYSFGGAPFHGSLGGITLNEPIVGIAPAANGNGYWLDAADGGVFSFGDAGYFGSMGGKALNKPIVGMAATADGYWLVASDGGIFSFGDAGYFGSMGGKTLNKPIVAMAATADGNGYWLVASDGGIFSFGDAGFFGSMGGKTLNEPIVGMASTSGGNGYWLVASDGGIFSFGAAGFFGSMGGRPLNGPITGMTATSAGNGYWEVAADGGIFTFGAAAFTGSASSFGARNVVGMASAT